MILLTTLCLNWLIADKGGEKEAILVSDGKYSVASYNKLTS